MPSLPVHDCRIGGLSEQVVAMYVASLLERQLTSLVRASPTVVVVGVGGGAGGGGAGGGGGGGGGGGMQTLGLTLCTLLDVLCTSLLYKPCTGHKKPVHKPLLVPR